MSSKDPSSSPLPIVFVTALINDFTAKLPGECMNKKKRESVFWDSLK